jgi:hypothetical protein
MEKYHAFENWLKSNNYVSWKSYLSFMRQIENTLLVKELESISSTSILKKLLLDLEGNRAFQARSESDKSNILSGFRAYIKFIEQKKGKPI